MDILIELLSITYKVLIVKTIKSNFSRLDFPRRNRHMKVTLQNATIQIRKGVFIQSSKHLKASKTIIFSHFKQFSTFFQLFQKNSKQKLSFRLWLKFGLLLDKRTCSSPHFKSRCSQYFNAFSFPSTLFLRRFFFSLLLFDVSTFHIVNTQIGRKLLLKLQNNIIN